MAAPGRPIAADLDANIRACDLFVLLWSENARASDWVPQEIGIATATRREIMPVVLHEGLTPPAFLSSLKYLELYRDPQAAANWLHRFVFEKVQAQQQLQTMLVVAGIAAVLVVASKAK